MKFTRILALALVALMAALCLASCGAETINVKLTIECGDAGDYPFVLEGVTVPLKSNDPTVLQAFIEGCIVNEIEYTLTEDEKGVKDIGEYKDYVDTETNTTYYWLYTVNGEEPNDRAADHIVADGDVVVFTYTAYVPDAE